MLIIGLTGIPGSGKTTLSRAIASKCREIPNLKNIELVQEYARRYISKHGNISSIMEQYRILQKQIEWENSVKNDKLDILISDSPIFSGFVYCCGLPKTNSKEIMFFNDIFKEMVKLNYPEPRYDIIFHLLPDIEPIRDGVRPEQHFNADWRYKSNLMIQATMNIFKPKNFYIVEPVKLECRTEFCIEKIKECLINNVKY